MPELPEVEFCARRLRAWTAGRRVARVEAEAGSPLATPPAALAEALVGAPLGVVERHGKQLFVPLPTATLAVHLGMTGKIVRVPAAAPARPGTRLRLTLDDAHRLDYVDVRRFGHVELLDAAGVAAARARLGPDALALAADPVALAARFVGARPAIKVALLDQRRLAGVGNIYAAEALYLALVHPWTPAGAVAAWPALAAGLVQTFTASLAREQDEEIRYLQEGAASPFLVYGREGEACPRCATPIARTAQQGRSTFWCPGCQPPAAS